MRILKYWSVPIQRRRRRKARQMRFQSSPTRPPFYVDLRSLSRATRAPRSGVSMLMAFAMCLPGCNREEAGLRSPKPTSEIPTVEDSPATATYSARPSPAATAAAGTAGDNAAGAHGCAALGLVSARSVEEFAFELERRDVNAVINALQEHARAGSHAQLLAPATAQGGKQGLRMLGVGSQAECGIRTGDIILEVNGVPVADQSALSRNRAQLSSASELEVLVERDGGLRTLKYEVKN